MPCRGKSSATAEAADACKVSIFGSLDEEQRQLYRLRNESALTGREIAARLGQDAGAVSKKCTYLDQIVAKRFHVLLLIRESSTKCTTLQQILEDYGHQRDFTAELADLVIEHYSTCRTCGNCAVCRGVQRQLVWDAAPVAIPITLAAAFRERIELAVQEVVNATSLPSGLRQSPPSPPRPPGPPAPTVPGVPPKSRLRRHAIQTGSCPALSAQAPQPEPARPLQLHRQRPSRRRPAPAVRPGRARAGRGR
ncbi:hypothetical protein [Streptomyces sp. MS2.AVA.5]|uniref:Uncharacterized protein n=1 Tax=Streptomyces achmelvichensis TaxID=3134111 RepID=A0ACC6Q8B3_9ACTN